MNNKITVTLPYESMKEYEQHALAFLITIKYFKTDEEKQRLLDYVQTKYSGDVDTANLIKDYFRD